VTQLEALAARKGSDPGRTAAEVLLAALGSPAQPGLASSAGGYRWKDLTLPEGTELSFKHRGVTYVATVTAGRILHNGRDVSPSQFINAVAGPGRNAWLGLWVRRPDDPAWLLAEDLRRAVEMSFATRQAMALSATSSLTGMTDVGRVGDQAKPPCPAAPVEMNPGTSMSSRLDGMDQLPLSLQALRSRRRRRRFVGPPASR
jgi:hypothetical protein